MPVKLIIADVDGCLSPEESVSWDFTKFAELVVFIKEATYEKRTLAPMTLCTGRPQPYTEVLMKLLDIRYPAICESGAVIYDLKGNYAKYAPGITKEKILGLRCIRTMIETEILPEYPGTAIQFGKEAMVSVFSHDTSLFPEIMSRVREFALREGSPELSITTTHCYVNICLKELDKGRAIRNLLSDLGLSRETAAGIGDTDGDLPLREAVGFFACPSNSYDSVKSTADYVSPYPTIEGMLDILRRPELRTG